MATRPDRPTADSAPILPPGSRAWRVVGVDLAWGERMRDGVCCLDTEADGRGARVVALGYPHGDDELIALLHRWSRPDSGAAPAGVFVTIDAPIVCPNLTGTRPVDRETHRRFHREHAACHPANLGKCPRPPRVRARCEALGAVTATGPADGAWVLAEVYPHPAVVRLFGLERIIKYKRGPVAARRREFRRLQRLLRAWLEDRASEIDPGPAGPLLRQPWSKPVEDRTDALLCALIGWWRLRHGAEGTEVLGDLASGFILVPRPAR